MGAAGAATRSGPSLRGAQRRGNPDDPGSWIASPPARNDDSSRAVTDFGTFILFFRHIRYFCIKRNFIPKKTIVQP